MSSIRVKLKGEHKFLDVITEPRAFGFDHCIFPLVIQKVCKHTREFNTYGI